VKRQLKQKEKRASSTHPSSLFCNPSCDIFKADESTDVGYDFMEETLDSSLENCHCHPVAKAEEGNHPTPIDISIPEQSEITKQTLSCT
jgi:hypothetical protein